MVESAPYEHLARRGEALRQLLSDQARRPYVLEVTGTPKAGKTSTIQMIESFFKSCEWKVHVLKERAGECPIPMKGHFFFNSWTTATMLAQVLEIVDREIDLVILDRGFFDALIWLELQRTRRQVTNEEAEAFTNFVLLDRWRELVDLTIVMTVDPQTAMEREQHDKLIPRRGSVMKESALAEFNASLETATQKYGNRFPLLERTSKDSNKTTVAAGLVQDLLDRVEPWADPDIAVVSIDLVKELFASGSALRWPTAAWERICSEAKAVKRSVAEKDAALVQLVACGVPIGSEGVFVFDRTKDKKRLGEYGPHSVWSGQHVELVADGSVDLESAKKSLMGRMRTNLHFNFDFDPDPLGIVWVNDEKRPRSKQHLGLFLGVRIGDENVAQSLVDKEFRTRGRGHPATSKFSTLEALRGGELELESWSQLVVNDGWLNDSIPSE